jgi:hypothetical protein
MAVKDAPSLGNQIGIVQLFLIFAAQMFIILFTLLVSDTFWRWINLPSIWLAG